MANMGFHVFGRVFSSLPCPSKVASPQALFLAEAAAKTMFVYVGVLTAVG